MHCEHGLQRAFGTVGGAMQHTCMSKRSSTHHSALHTQVQRRSVCWRGRSPIPKHTTIRLSRDTYAQRHNGQIYHRSFRCANLCGNACKYTTGHVRQVHHTTHEGRGAHTIECIKKKYRRTLCLTIAQGTWGKYTTEHHGCV
jgi:hypothetical protein